MELIPSMNEPMTPESPCGPVWKPDLYKLQQEAPKPQEVLCQDSCSQRPQEYGKVYHGNLSSLETAILLKKSGEYLVRLSRDHKTTLSLRWKKVLHFRLYYDGRKHYVRESRRFETLNDLVADGLITLHIESEAGSYLQLMCDLARYEKSPAYMTLTRFKRIAKPLLMTHEEEEILYEKKHQFKTHNFKGFNWCEFCSNFIWGFTAQGVKCDDCGFSAHFKCSEKLPSDCCPELKSVRSVFGVDLTAFVRSRRTARPFIVDKCVHEIESRGLQVEGLYRISGFADEMDSLRMTLERDGENADISANVYDNINVVAGILKQYFRLLPIPLLTYEVHPFLIKSSQLHDLNEQIEGAKKALQQLPRAHYNTLKFLMAHLQKVDQNQAVNKMSSFNLSTVFAPTLMPPSNSKMGGAIPDMSGEINILNLLIQQQESIFQN